MSETERTRELIADLSSGPRRGAGTDAERRAAKQLVRELAADGRPAMTEPIYVHPQWATVHMLHCLFALAGSLLATVEPAAGFALVLFTALSLYLDLSGRAYLLRRLLFRRASQNVVSPPIGEEPADRIFICAHYDAPRTGAAYNPGMLRAFRLLQRLWPAKLSPQALVFWLIALLLPPLGLRMAGLEEGWVAILQLPQSLALIAAAFLFGEIALSPTSPGANDNASGVAAALAAARRLRDEQPQRLSVHVLLCGAGESTREGFRSFLRSHRTQLPAERTWFVELDSVGHGNPRFVQREIPVLGVPLDADLSALADALSEGSEGLEPLDPGPAGAASLAVSYGYPAIAITAREGGETYPARHHSPADLAAEVSETAVIASAELTAQLVQLLDRQLQRRPSGEPEPAAA